MQCEDQVNLTEGQPTRVQQLEEELNSLRKYCDMYETQEKRLKEVEGQLELLRLAKTETDHEKEELSRRVQQTEETHSKLVSQWEGAEDVLSQTLSNPPQLVRIFQSKDFQGDIISSISP